MITKICAVRDRAVEAYGQPIFVNALGQAIRSFSDEINNKDSNFSRHPGDYELFHLGVYDDQNGLVQALEAPVLLASGKEMVIKE